AVYKSLVQRAQQHADASIGVPFNFCNWGISYDAVLLYADVIKRLGMDGRTDTAKAREAIKDEFTKLKAFTGAHRYTFRDTGDAYIGATVLAADVDRKVWKYMDK
ncbi:MAG: hypothetical protein H7346_11740, partial [Burkholderiaceae bacterium]|nr:hypothetical protein [Burkholderiaceae bacterium]